MEVQVIYIGSHGLVSVKRVELAGASRHHITLEPCTAVAVENAPLHGFLSHNSFECGGAVSLVPIYAAVSLLCKQLVCLLNTLTHYISAECKNSCVYLGFQGRNVYKILTPLKNVLAFCI
ncbi:MAG: hypothetical protein LUE97_07000 [Oscillospiraceae bacterium]|nr:hypothetical protein [Oscillospiraceae bacterium]